VLRLVTKSTHRVAEYFKIVAGPAFCLMVVVAVMCADVHTQDTAGVRRIHPRPGVPLASRISPSDRVVEVYPFGGEQLQVEADTERTLEILGASDSVILATVTDIHSSLTSDGSWVRTRLSVNLSDVLLNRRPGSVERGKPLTLDIDGGEIVLEKVVVRVGYFDILQVGQEYLLGVGPCANGACEVRMALHVSPTRRLDSPDRSPSGAPGTGDKLKGMTLEQITSYLRQR
jgi:hypothetical protein